jgi:hypothetical protein
MNQVGITTDGRPLVAGVFPLLGTHGVRLEVIIAELARAALVVSWPDHVADARADGHKPARVKTRVLEAVEDVHGADSAREVGARLERVLRDLPGRQG